MIRHHAKLVVEPIAAPESMRAALVNFSAGRLPAILESSRVTKPYGRYSVLACDPAAVVTIEAKVEVDAEADCDGDVVDLLQKAFARWPSLDNSTTKLPLSVGWIGYLSYEAGLPLVGLASRYGSAGSTTNGLKPKARSSKTGAILAQFYLYDYVAVFDAWLDRWYAVVVDWPAKTPRNRPAVACRLAAVRDLLNQDSDNHHNYIQQANVDEAESTATISKVFANDIPDAPSISNAQAMADVSGFTNAPCNSDSPCNSDAPRNSDASCNSGISLDKCSALASPLTNGGLRGVSSTVEPLEPTISASMSRNQYFQQFAKAMSYIEAGDVYEVNLAIRFEALSALSPIEQYLRLRESSPSTNAAFLPWNDCAILSTSPELFIELRDGRVITRPIKGTRARLDDPVADDIQKQDLTRSEKDRAELNMIVDLMRNDLGRVCNYGSVKVLEAAAIESLPTVYQQVATIEGRLAKQYEWPDLLRAAFPGGSITGAPKIRAMQIIDQLEPVDREVYCGSIGIIGLDGSMTLNIAIRTMVQQGDRVKFWAGGAIVADSDPQAEYDEILAKTVGLRRALVETQSLVSSPALPNKKETVI